MSVYLGTYGQVQLRRTSEETEKLSTVDAGDINVSRRRFSFDFDEGFLTTGDQIEIASTNGALLEFVAAAGWTVNAKQSTGHWYINVDELGGIRLYTSFDQALEGLQSNAIVLEAIVTPIPISVRVRNTVPRLLAQCSYFELNTSRETVDTTALGEEFRSQYSTLISGSGSFRAFWDYLPTYIKSSAAENAHYLLQLAIRTEIGSRFAARLYLRVGNQDGTKTTIDDEIWYDIEGVITQAGVSFATDNVVEITADFVTTGPIRLLAKTTPSNKVLQENADDIRLEQDATASLLQEDIQ